jgi:thioredoxin reductase (NADPH)
MTYYGDEAFPALSDEQWARLQAYGSAQELESGALVSGVGEATYNLILVDSGEAEVIRAATSQAAEAVVARFGTAQFAGELSLPTGQATYLSSRVSKPGQVHRIYAPNWMFRESKHYRPSAVLGAPESALGAVFLPPPYFACHPRVHAGPVFDHQGQRVERMRS